MTSLVTRASAATRSRDSSISLVFEATTGTWSAVAFMRTQEGIFFLESCFGQNRPDFNTVFMTAFMRGRYSKRPYQLGQAIDASIDNCVLALFHDLCEARGLKAYGWRNSPIRMNLRCTLRQTLARSSLKRSGRATPLLPRGMRSRSRCYIARSMTPATGACAR